MSTQVQNEIIKNRGVIRGGWGTVAPRKKERKKRKKKKKRKKEEKIERKKEWNYE